MVHNWNQFVWPAALLFCPLYNSDLIIVNFVTIMTEHFTAQDESMGTNELSKLKESTMCTLLGYV